MHWHIGHNYCCDTAVGLCPLSDKMQHSASDVSETAVSPSSRKKEG